MTRQNDLAVEVKMASHTLTQCLEQIDGALDPAVGTEPTRTELLKMLALVSSDLALVQRTLAGVERRMR